jgi:hypothetical protein
MANLPGQASPSQTHSAYTFKAGANGRTADGADFSLVAYTGPDGIVVAARTETYTTRPQAEKALQRQLKRAIKITSRTPRLDSSGQRVGTRIVARFSRAEQYIYPATIFWTDGTVLHSIGSVSLRGAIEFEKKFYRGEK